MSAMLPARSSITSAYAWSPHRLRTALHTSLWQPEATSRETPPGSPPYTVAGPRGNGDTESRREDEQPPSTASMHTPRGRSFRAQPEGEGTTSLTARPCDLVRGYCGRVVGPPPGGTDVSVVRRT